VLVPLPASSTGLLFNALKFVLSYDSDFGDVGKGVIRRVMMGTRLRPAPRAVHAVYAA